MDTKQEKETSEFFFLRTALPRNPGMICTAPLWSSKEQEQTPRNGSSVSCSASPDVSNIVRMKGLNIRFKLKEQKGIFIDNLLIFLASSCIYL